MLAVELPHVRHEQHGVQRALAAPGSARRMRALASELEESRNEGEGGLVAPGDAEFVAHVREERRIHVPEYAGAHQVRLARQLFLSDPGPEHDRAGNLLAGHDLFRRECRRDVERHAAVVPFPVSRRAGHDPLPGRCPRFLIRLREPSMSDPREMTGLPLPQRATQAVGMPATPRCTVNPFCSRMPARYFDVSVSCMPSSPNEKT